MIKGFPNFTAFQKEIKQQKVYQHLKTLVIDIEDTLITRIEILNFEELNIITLQDDYKENYIIIKKIIKFAEKE